MVGVRPRIGRGRRPRAARPPIVTSGRLLIPPVNSPLEFDAGARLTIPDRPSASCLSELRTPTLSAPCCIFATDA